MKHKIYLCLILLILLGFFLFTLLNEKLKQKSITKSNVKENRTLKKRNDNHSIIKTKINDKTKEMENKRNSKKIKNNDNPNKGTDDIQTDDSQKDIDIVSFSVFWANPPSSENFSLIVELGDDDYVNFQKFCELNKGKVIRFLGEKEVVIDFKKLGNKKYIKSIIENNSSHINFNGLSFRIEDLTVSDKYLLKVPYWKDTLAYIRLKAIVDKKEISKWEKTVHETEYNKIHEVGFYYSERIYKLKVSTIDESHKPISNLRISINGKTLSGKSFDLDKYTDEKGEHTFIVERGIYKVYNPGSRVYYTKSVLSTSGKLIDYRLTFDFTKIDEHYANFLVCAANGVRLKVLSKKYDSFDPVFIAFKNIFTEQKKSEIFVTDRGYLHANKETWIPFQWGPLQIETDRELMCILTHRSGQTFITNVKTQKYGDKAQVINFPEKKHRFKTVEILDENNKPLSNIECYICLYHKNIYDNYVYSIIYNTKTNKDGIAKFPDFEEFRKWDVYVHIYWEFSRDNLGSIDYVNKSVTSRFTWDLVPNTLVLNEKTYKKSDIDSYTRWQFYKKLERFKYETKRGPKRKIYRENPKLYNEKLNELHKELEGWLKDFIDKNYTSDLKQEKFKHFKQLLDRRIKNIKKPE